MQQVKVMNSSKLQSCGHKSSRHRPILAVVHQNDQITHYMRERGNPFTFQRAYNLNIKAQLNSFKPLCIEGWKGKQPLLVSSKPFNLAAGLACSRPSHRCACLSGCTGLGWTWPGKSGRLLKERVYLCPNRQASSLCDVCVQSEKNVDSLPMAKPALQLLILEIRHGYA